MRLSSSRSVPLARIARSSRGSASEQCPAWARAIPFCASETEERGVDLPAVCALAGIRNTVMTSENRTNSEDLPNEEDCIGKLYSENIYILFGVVQTHHHRLEKEASRHSEKMGRRRFDACLLSAG